MDKEVQQNCDRLISALVTHFGVTRVQQDGGYILPDGRLLNLHRSDTDNRQYHRAVAALLPAEMQGACDELTIVNLMVATGVIRYEARGRVHTAVKPTQSQRRKLFELMKYSEQWFRVIASDSNGATIGDEVFKSPPAHELLQFFSACYDDSQKVYREDEFGIQPTDTGFALMFRPAQRQIGVYESDSDTMTVIPEFSNLLSLFERRVAQYQVFEPT
ncbi:hypothetical protein [Photobacterium atrarenae]|uniref:DUF1828 domain-containing protein n=1 Tax=Photobacterium atrarenae TaxID=865757 RepID=A0ABY5GJ57_9GAMM|nr:hypothetical protein [Photobacterium atrarenae]UTV29161.1 hypothetical protein NNL38_08045 [Photobacterium atrarenae]